MQKPLCHTQHNTKTHEHTTRRTTHTHHAQRLHAGCETGCQCVCSPLLSSLVFFQDVDPVYPRSPEVNNVLAEARIKERSRKRTELVDRGIGTMQDGYSSEQHPKIVNYYMQKNNFVGLRWAFDHLYAHACTMRGQDRRSAELADLFCWPLPQLSKWKLQAYITLMDNGKTNKAGRKEVAAMIRHKSLDICQRSPHCHEASLPGRGGCDQQSNPC
mmetsp:Transcript_13690/g.34930  ORF Transcript_13690/g.34930 Transcript_13690/m.34930 type:complete len:215 (-) Transcript_13690:443-1087(-)